MPRVYVVRADAGRHTDHFIRGGYVAIGQIPERTLANAKSRTDIEPLYRAWRPDDMSRAAAAVQIAQIARFLFEMQDGDFVITPGADSESLPYGRLGPDSTYYFASVTDGCPFPHRRRVSWAAGALRRSKFSTEFQKSIRASMTIFQARPTDEFFRAVGAAAGA